MPLTPDYKVREMARARPRLRRDLVWTMQRFRDGAGWVLEDPVTRRFFRVGLREKEFLDLLDGRRTVSEAVAAHAAMDLAGALNDSAASSTVRWLIDQGLTETAEEGHCRRVGEELRRERAPKKLLAGLGGLFFLRLPLGSPDALLGRLLPWFRWAFSGWFLAVWMLVAGYAAVRLGAGWGQFAEEGARFFAAGNPLLPLACWAGLKFLHELWHGLACKHFGGGVHDAGIILLLFVTPMGYVDASSSLRFPSRRRRMAVAAAGMFIEVFVAALAFLAWEHAQPGFGRTLLHQIVMVAGIGTVAFNMNPLMRFDGYFLLSDLAGVPNLYGKGQAAASALITRLLFGRQKGRENPHGFWVTAYGVAAFFWRWMVTLTLFLAAIFLFKGAGVVLAVIALAGLLAQTAANIARGARAARRSREVRWGRAVVRGGLAAAGVWAFAVYVPLSPGEVADGAVEFLDPAILRVECPGFVREVRVAGGDEVAAGDLLVVLENREEQAELARIRSELARSELAEQSYLAEGNVAGALAQRAISGALSTRLRAQADYLATLEVRAPVSGVVHGEDLSNLPGSYLAPGSEILTIALPGRFRIVMAISAAQEPVARENTGRKAAFRLAGSGRSGQGVLTLVEPRAGLLPPHWTLSAQWGGPLAIDRAAAPERASTAGGRRDEARLASPVFKGVLAIEEADREGLMDGQRAKVYLAASEPVTAWRLIRKMFDAAVERTRAGTR